MIATIITAIAGIYLLAGLLVLGPRKPGYSHIRHTISELGESGSPDQRLVGFGLFLPVGLLLLLAAWLVQPAAPTVAALALCIGIGYLGATAFPCDPGCPAFGTTRQVLHNVAGAIEYVGGGFALILIAERFGRPFEIVGVIVLGAGVALSVSALNSVRGVIQRVAEACLFCSLAGAAHLASL